MLAITCSSLTKIINSTRISGEEYNEWILQPVQPSVDFTDVKGGGDGAAASGGAGGKEAQAESAATPPAAAADVDSAATATGHSSGGEGKTAHGCQVGGTTITFCSYFEKKKTWVA